MNELVTALFSFIEFICGFICILTIFRLPIRYYLLRITIMALIFSIITTFTFANFPDYALLINFSCMTVMFAIAYQLPFFYSLLITFVFYLLGIILEYGITSLTGNFFHIDLEIGSFGLRLIYVITGLLYLLIAWLLERKKYGFMFIARYFTMRNSVKGYNFALSAVLIVSIVAIQLASLILVNRTFNYWNFCLLILVTILFLLAILIAYKQNKKQLEEKHARLGKK